MATSGKISDRRLEKFLKKSSGARDYGTKDPRKYFLIVCEGEKTEPNYFEAISKELPKGLVSIDIIPGGTETLRIVELAEELAGKIRSKRNIPLDQVWAVFDKDSFPVDHFDNAIHKAKSKGIKCAWSNEAFELWYLLHFNYIDSGISRDTYKARLSRHIGKTYKKNDPDMYKLLQDKTSTAIKNSKKLAEAQVAEIPSKANPCTQVHLLAEELLKFLKKE